MCQVIIIWTFLKSERLTIILPIIYQAFFQHVNLKNA